jgi:hypothetical protein
MHSCSSFSWWEVHLFPVFKHACTTNPYVHFWHPSIELYGKRSRRLNIIRILLAVKLGASMIQKARAHHKPHATLSSEDSGGLGLRECYAKQGTISQRAPTADVGPEKTCLGAQARHSGVPETTGEDSALAWCFHNHSSMICTIRLLQAGDF